MFSTTFLGHQGWLVQSSRACLLIDPLLCKDFGQTHALEYRVYPPRILTNEAFPKIDALILSHEHDDHFDIPSLAKLDRKIPVFLSARSSIAAHEILKKMGFGVTPIEPGVPFRVGDLEVIPFCGDHMSVNCSDEWDTLPYLIKHTGGAGSFFSMVDITMTPEHVEWARAHVQRPGLVTWTNNAMDWSHMAAFLSERTEGTEQCFVKMGMGHKMITNTWGTPAAMLMCAGGFAFQGERAWLNERVFCVDTKVVCEKLSAIYPKEKFYSTLPGQTFEMESNRIRKIDPTAPFLRTTPANEWPSRARTQSKEAHDFAPATGVREFTEKDAEKVAVLLNEFAAALVGSFLFKSLHSILTSEMKDLTPTFVFSLRRSDGRPLVFEYNPNACAFKKVTNEESHPETTYLAGMECWGSDLLSVLRGELGPIALLFARAKLWNNLPKRFQFDVFEELYRMSHPLRRPAAFLRTYERFWEQSASTVPTIFGR